MYKVKEDEVVDRCGEEYAAYSQYSMHALQWPTRRYAVGGMHSGVP